MKIPQPNDEHHAYLRWLNTFTRYATWPNALGAFGLVLPHLYMPMSAVSVSFGIAVGLVAARIGYIIEDRYPRRRGK